MVRAHIWSGGMVRAHLEWWNGESSFGVVEW